MYATSLPTWPAPKSTTWNRGEVSLASSTREKLSRTEPPQHCPRASPSANRRSRRVSPERSISRAIFSAVYSRLPPPMVPRTSVALTHMRVPASRGAEPRVSASRISMGMDGFQDVLGRGRGVKRHRLARIRRGADGVVDGMEDRQREHERRLADRFRAMGDVAYVLALLV